jgi:UDP-3-O-[3-hydroxymyristoyl] glucosamine N-acyltransferase
VLHHNIIKGCEEARLGDYSVTSLSNRISGPPLSRKVMPHAPDRYPALFIGRGTDLTSQHRIDCSDTVTFEDGCVLGGRRSMIFTHFMDVTTGKVVTKPVRVGANCLINSGVIIQPGVDLPERTMVAPGAVVEGSPGQPEQMIGGVPARPIKRLPGAAWFFRPNRADQGRDDELS